MTRLIPWPSPSHALGLTLVALALCLAAVPDPVPGAEPGVEAPSCVGCHDSAWPAPAPDASLTPLEQALRDRR